MKIAVTTPTGNIGSKLTERLLAEGAEVAVLARRPEKVSALAARAARVVKMGARNRAQGTNRRSIGCA